MFDLWRPQNIRFINREDCDEKGVCYEESKMTWITLHKHLSEQDIIYTSIEESIHQCLAMCGMTEILYLLGGVVVMATPEMERRK